MVQGGKLPGEFLLLFCTVLATLLYLVVFDTTDGLLNECFPILQSFMLTFFGTAPAILCFCYVPTFGKYEAEMSTLSRVLFHDVIEKCHFCVHLLE